uniref:RXLR2 n=1 Tax=Albugo laibachii Nc14 TaxID=890382 RepID=F0WNB2_9STRA|nr:RXLR2 [Albugo laibachii Nc14]|eukprot:CCA22801.1 RXLR2 [Albugo laibachii Nc14]
MRLPSNLKRVWFALSILLLLFYCISVLFTVRIQTADPRVPVKYLPRRPAIRSSNEEVTSGIVLCLFEGIMDMGVSLIRELRCLGNEGVIQVHHCMNELSTQSQQLLRSIDDHIQIIDICEQVHHRNLFPKGVKPSDFRGYWIKPLALIFTNLTEVVLMDADDIFLQDPVSLRKLSGYAKTGTLFFYDRHVKLNNFLMKNVKGKPLLYHLIDTFDYAQFGLRGPSPSERLKKSLAYRGKVAHEQDSSLVLIDKSRAGKAMKVLEFLIFHVRFKMQFSWGDKEAYWLAYELAQQEYFFSPWGVSLLNSVPNKCLENHPDTLCGSMAHFVPYELDSEPSEVLYVNGKALLQPYPAGVSPNSKIKLSRMYNPNPTHITPRFRRSDVDLNKQKSFECMDDLGSEELPQVFRAHLLRRRLHFLALSMDYLPSLNICHV